MGSPTCTAECVALFGQGCDAELTALLVCGIKDASDACDFANCQLEIQAYVSCSQPSSCGTFECFGGVGGCGCKGECNGSQLETKCDNGLCVCLQDGLEVGSCGGGDCDPLDGCCADFFFELQ
jgi:hypothetical protein